MSSRSFSRKSFLKRSLSSDFRDTVGIDAAFCIRGLAGKITHRAFPFKVISKSNSDTASNWFITSTRLLVIWGVIAEFFSKVTHRAFPFRVILEE